MKTIKQIREEYDSAFLNQVEELPEEIMLEASDKSFSNRVPSSKEMPYMLIFKRVQFRLFPDKTTVAMYYSKTLNKYLTIPFGPKGNVNMSEAVLIDADMLNEDLINEDWQSVNRKDKTDGLSQAAVNAYRRENPGSKLKTAVTEKNPKGKRAARRKSFCSRMGGMKKRLTSAKTARDPDSNINKALRRWNCEEAFYNKLHEKRMQQDEGVLSALDTGAEAMLPYYSAGKKAIKGDWAGAATDAAVDTALMATTAGAGKVAMGAAKLGAKAIGSGALKGAGRSITRAATKVGGRAGAKLARGAGKVVRGAGKVAGKLGRFADALSGDSSDDDQKTEKPSILHPSSNKEAPHAKVRSYTAAELSRNKSSDTAKSIEAQAYRKSAQAALAPGQQKENKISDIRNMIAEGVSVMELPINGRTVKLNSSMAKRIVEVYDSVNTKNKKVVEGMLNEDLETFKRLLNFSIKV